MDEILEILEKDARVSPKEIATMVGGNVESVKRALKKYEKEGIILGYKAILNKQLLKGKEQISKVQALIEVNIIPEKNVGFDYVAERIYRFPEVSSCYLLSGTYDLLLVVEGKSIHTISSFIAEKLSSMENVRGTVTHFLLKKYKEDGCILNKKEKNKRMAISY